MLAKKNVSVCLQENIDESEEKQGIVPGQVFLIKNSFFTFFWLNFKVI